MESLTRRKDTNFQKSKSGENLREWKLLYDCDESSSTLKEREVTCFKNC